MKKYRPTTKKSIKQIEELVELSIEYRKKYNQSEAKKKEAGLEGYEKDKNALRTAFMTTSEHTILNVEEILDTMHNIPGITSMILPLCQEWRSKRNIGRLDSANSLVSVEDFKKLAIAFYEKNKGIKDIKEVNEFLQVKQQLRALVISILMKENPKDPNSIKPQNIVDQLTDELQKQGESLLDDLERRILTEWKDKARNPKAFHYVKGDYHNVSGTTDATCPVNFYRPGVTSTSSSSSFTGRALATIADKQAASHLRDGFVGLLCCSAMVGIWGIKKVANYFGNTPNPVTDHRAQTSSKKRKVVLHR